MRVSPILKSIYFCSMFVSGFTFVKNAVKLDYPVVQAIKSILPLCDEVVVAVGKSEDETRELVASISDKVRILDTEWDEDLRVGGKVLAVETDKAKSAVSAQADWLVYIQADECMHEADYAEIRQSMEAYLSDINVEGFLFNYLHFYGSYDYLGDSRTWYRKEIRVIRNDPKIQSWKDAQGFRKGGDKLQVKPLNAHVHHYGWVRHPKHMMSKARAASRYWKDDEWIDKKFDAEKEFDYTQIDSIKRFTGSHPAVMRERISEMNWTFDRDPKVKKFKGLKAFLYLFEKYTGIRIGENKNYTVLK
jgi:hypothetical protein